MGTHQGNPLVGPLFDFTHFHALHYSSRVFPSCLFLSLANDIYILGYAHVLSLTFDHVVSQLVYVRLCVQPHKWTPFNLPLGFIPLVEFYYPHDDIKIFGIPFVFTSFTSFLQETLSKDVWHANVLPRLRDV
jgi:hypothetical protein